MKIRLPEYKWQIFFVTGLASVTASIAMSSVNLALPVIADDFGISMSAVSWLTLAYAIIASCTQLIFGRFADLFGYKRQFVFGFLVYGISSALIALVANGLAAMIVFRCIQAVSFAMMMSITQALCNRTFPESERGMALGVNAIFVSVGLSVGPSISGLLMSYFSWRSIFVFNLPFCVLGVVLSALILKKDEIDTTKSQRMDWPGSLFFALFIGLLAFAINFSSEWGVASFRFAGFIAVSVVSLIVFIYRESHTKMPLVNLAFFRNPVFALSNTANLCTYIILQMNTFLAPFFLINILSVSSSDAGLILLASPIAQMIIAPIGGRLSDRYGSRKLSIAGLSIIAIGCVFLSMMKDTTPILWVTGGLLLFGAGNGVGTAALNSTIFSAVPKDHSGMTSGMVSTMRNLGQVIAVSSAGAIMAARQNRYLARAVEAGAAAPDGNGIYVMAQRDAYYFGVCVAALAILCMVLIAIRKPEQKSV